jgi:hypothetical protein
MALNVYTAIVPSWRDMCETQVGQCAHSNVHLLIANHEVQR